ncbi:unnamed protein product [Meloidogyne enterolobii]|uniref:Uncharacterized protein n=1 Tax=Meloidogyne enterolobii TaxID=390850 RepID=A0ACB0ZAJ3_MELEN
MSKFVCFLLIVVFVYIQLCDCGKDKKVVSDDDKGVSEDKGDKGDKKGVLKLFSFEIIKIIIKLRKRPFRRQQGRIFFTYR